MENKTPENKMVFLLALLAGIVGGAICMALNGYKNLGTVADWVSGIGSCGAVIVALWQIIAQRNKEEKDKKLANRPFFSLMGQLYLQRNHKLWLLPKDKKIIRKNDFFDVTEPKLVKFKNKIRVFEFKNVSQAVATNVALKIEYQNKATGEVLGTDYYRLETCVMKNEKIFFLPHSILHKPYTYSYCNKSIDLYFTTIDDRAYHQKWIEKYDKSDSQGIKQVNIEEVPIEEMPSGAKCSNLFIN